MTNKKLTIVELITKKMNIIHHLPNIVLDWIYRNLLGKLITKWTHIKKIIVL